MSDLGLTSKLKGKSVIQGLIGNSSNQYEIKEVKPSILMSYNNNPGFPFKIHEGKRREELTQSIKNNGITTPFIVRPIPVCFKDLRPDCEYEIICGNNRNDIAMEIGLSKVPVVIRYDIEDDEKAVEILNEDNFLQRSDIMPSERAKAYKLQLDSRKVESKNKEICSNGTSSREEVAQDNDTSASQVRRFIRLNELNEGLLTMADENNIGFRSAVEISYLSSASQSIIETLIKNQNIKISLNNAINLKELEKEKEGCLNLDDILNIVSQKKNKKDKITIPTTKIEGYFREGVSNEEMINKIIELLEANMQ